MRIVLLLLLLALPVAGTAGWELTSPDVFNGEVAVLQWRGGDPPEQMVGTFAGQRFFAESSSLGPVALIGVDIETAAGSYPVRLVSVDRAGRPEPATLQLKVALKDRGVSRITLPPEMVEPKAPDVLARIARERQLLAELFAVDSGPLRADLFRRPVPEKVNSRFGKKRILNGLPRAPHSGTDFRSPSGRLIRTPARGRVVFSAELYYTGRTVILDHGAGLYSLYAHLLRPLCSVGQQLEAGQPLGKVGSTGRSTGAHLHWTVRLREARVDPMSLLMRFGTKTP